PFYLHVGEMVLEDLQKYARVECGFASVKDVLTKKLENLSLPPLDPYGYCEVPYTDPVIIDENIGESSHESSVQDGQLVIHVQYHDKN
ncbi:11560_t:CDS:2, partial [Racocetra fulgida]